MKKIKQQQGLSLVEVIVAATVLTTLLLGLFGSFSFGFLTTENSQRRAGKVLYAQEVMEACLSEKVNLANLPQIIEKNNSDSEVDKKYPFFAKVHRRQVENNIIQITVAVFGKGAPNITPYSVTTLSDVSGH
ncbi:MAG TPA: prepilin-type N-terminal cleavage/methylation domain-containing protein [Planctomycetota bacterium]|nr:prepilin-type N-terminal cleavage/methylation domain-containing protein [Planctomycetota bacterium]HQB00073.1 prepilin-type N-terminal cleavage/methylation domain-containing protein [Planctomycetota bacterium]